MINNLSLQFQRINELLRGAKRVLIASHNNPDADAVSSSLLSHYILNTMNLESFPYLPDLPSKNLSFLPGFSDIRTQIDSFDPDVLLCLDYGDFKRLRIPEHILAKDNCKIITIDHHLQSDQRGEVKILEPGFSSTAEILYYWLKHENIDINKDIANCLLTSIFSDSGGFFHTTTTPKTLSIVSELLSKGVSLDEIARQTLNFEKPLNLSQAWGQILSRIQLDEEKELAYSWFSLDDFEKFGVGIADFDGITNLISTSSKTNFGLFLVEYEQGKIKGSLRSEPHGGRNVADIVRNLGGGGHAYAAGFVQEGTIENVLKKVLNLLE